jgi:hypothetical protein
MNQIKVIQIIHFAFCTSILLFAGVTLFINMETLRFDLYLKASEPLEFLAPLITGIALFMGPFIFNKIIQNIDMNDDLSSKLMKYQAAFIVKCAILEAGAFMCIVACFITFNVLFMVFASLAFFSIWYAKPTKDKISSVLQLQDSDLM